MEALGPLAPTPSPPRERRGLVAELSCSGFWEGYEKALNQKTPKDIRTASMISS